MPRRYRLRSLGPAWRASLWLGCTVAILTIPDVGSAQGTAAPGIEIRRLESRHLTLITDLPASAEVNDLPSVFDQAVAQWCDYFEIPTSQVADWHVRGYLMLNRDRFRAAGWLPDKLPNFANGFQLGDEIWVGEQPSAYYRRHLLLHEGTHAFMNRWLGGTGPPWYTEGMAELLATHRMDQGRLTLQDLPRRKEDVPEWGRIKLIRDAVAAGQAKSWNEVLDINTRQFAEVEAYAWSWGLATLLEGHPRWHDRFRALAGRAAGDGNKFRQQLGEELQSDRDELDEAWQLFLHSLDYGYDIAEEQVVERPIRNWHGQAVADVDSRRAWQSTGLWLEAGKSYRLTARGRFRLNQQDPPWFSESGGVTIRYLQGRPLGMLLGAVRPESAPGRSTALIQPIGIGLQSELRPEVAGVLFLRINELAGCLRDNQGELQVEVHATPSAVPSEPD